MKVGDIREVRWGGDTPRQMWVLYLWCLAAEQGADVMGLVPGVCQGLPERAPGQAAQFRDTSTFCAGFLQWESSFSVAVPLDGSA